MIDLAYVTTTPLSFRSGPPEVPLGRVLILFVWISFTNRLVNLFILTKQLGSEVAPESKAFLGADKMFASLDVLTNGRMICGVGVGWLEKEFDILGVPYNQRGPMSDEFLQVFKVLWTESDPEFHGQFYNIDGIQFYPKPVQKPHIPIWVGGHTHRALRRTAKYGDCWHTTRQTPDFVAQNLPYLREQTEKAGRDPASISISLKRSLHFTDLGAGEGKSVLTGGTVIGTTQEVIDDIYYCRELGIDQLTYDFRVDGIDASIEVMERLADRVLPVASRLG
jgi:alkanesulfonate monooxygenase SsuD/methylene tetrahydromethanopterin reductase-like flavin-dependent oxidoreductase (luciferase family)